VRNLPAYSRIRTVASRLSMGHGDISCTDTAMPRPHDAGSARPSASCASVASRPSMDFGDTSASCASQVC
jgi:hypothetical protein